MLNEIQTHGKKGPELFIIPTCVDPEEGRRMAISALKVLHRRRQQRENPLGELVTACEDLRRALATYQAAWTETEAAA